MANDNWGAAISSVIAGGAYAQQNAANRKQQTVDLARSKVDLERAQVDKASAQADLDAKAYAATLRRRDEGIVAAQEARLALAAKESTTAAAGAERRANLASGHASQAAENANQFSQNQQAKQLQELEANNAVQVTSANTLIYNKITRTPGYDVNNPFQIVDPVGLSKTDAGSALLVDILNQDKKYQFTVIDGKRVELDVTGFKYMDGKVIPNIMRVDTKEELTPTERGSIDPEDKVLMQTNEDFTNYVNNSVASVFGNGGRQSKDFQALTITALNAAVANGQDPTAPPPPGPAARDAAVRNTISDKMPVEIFQDPAMARDFLGVLNSQSGEQLLEIADGLNIDLSGVEKTLADQQASDQSTFDRWNADRASKSGRSPGVGRSDDIQGLKTPEQVKIRNSIREKTNDLRWKGGVSGTFQDQTPAEAEMNTNAEIWYDKNDVILAGRMEANPALEEEFNKLGPTEFYKKRGLDTAGDPVPPEEMLLSMKSPPFKLTNEQIKKAIFEGVQKPDPEQVADRTQFLKDMGIATEAQLVQAAADGRLSAPDTRALIWSLASQLNGTPDENVASAQRFLNLYENGATDTTNNQQLANERADQSRTDGINSAVATRQNTLADEVRKNARADEDKALERAQTVVDTLPARVQEAMQSTTGFETSRAISNALAQPLRQLNQAMKNNQSRVVSELSSVINPAVSRILQNEAALEGWFDNVDPQSRDFNMNFVQWDGAEFAYVLPGGKQGGSVPQKTILKLGANILGIMKLAADKNRQVAEEASAAKKPTSGADK